MVDLRGKLTTAGAEATQAAGDTGEIERLRGILRAQRETIKHWQHHVLVTSRLLGCAAMDKDVEAAVGDLRHKLATARADAIRECVEAVHEHFACGRTPHHRDGYDYDCISELATALESLTKGEGDDGTTQTS